MYKKGYIKDTHNTNVIVNNEECHVCDSEFSDFAVQINQNKHADVATTLCSWIRLARDTNFDGYYNQNNY